MPKLFGQKQILEEINILVQDIINGTNHNILLRAPSGYGKTSLALNILYYLGWDKDGEYLLPEKGEIELDFNKKYHVIDEVHTLISPEFLYPVMDSKRHSFIFCTNEAGVLLEPLRNRCIQFIFQPYSDEEMFEMIEYFMRAYHLPRDFLIVLQERTKNNPRVASKLCERLAYIFTWKGIPNTVEELISILEKTLNVGVSGLNQNDVAYINFLSRVGNSSLDTISLATGIDKTTIRSEIEPFLLYKGLIKITSKGRQWL